MTTSEATAGAGSRRHARFAVALFLILIPVLVAGPLWARSHAAHRDATFDFVCLAALTWAPALSALIARGVLREGLADVSFAWPRARLGASLATTFGVPLAVGLISYGAAWGIGLAPFSPPATAPWPGAAPALRFGALLATDFVRDLPRWGLLALGEEIGWRGYLLPRLIQSGLPRPVLLSALVWGAWHVPSILWGGYPAGPNRPVSALIIFVTLGAFGFVLARQRLESGSIWPPTLAHATWNSVLMQSFESATRTSTLWTRETGVLTALASLVVCGWVARGVWTARLDPREAPFAFAPGQR